jgi:hypothetical protein
MATDENVGTLLMFIDNQLSPEQATQLLKVRQELSTCMTAI